MELDTTGELRSFVRELLASSLNASNHSLPSISEATGIEYHTLRRFYVEDGADMSSTRIQKLYEYLTGKKLLEADSDRRAEV